MSKKIKVICSVCHASLEVPFEGERRIPDHQHSGLNVKVRCYGSFMPVFERRGDLLVGNIFYIPRSGRSSLGGILHAPVQPLPNVVPIEDEFP